MARTTKSDTAGGGPPARLLDITRLMSRAGRGLTGVDRVELAYLHAFLADPVPLYALARSAFGYLLLDQAGASAFRDCVGADDWGRPSGLSHLARKLTPAQRAAQSRVREFASARCLRGRLDVFLPSHLPSGTVYFNVGHSNFDARTAGAMRNVQGGRIAVFVHDTIPLDFPQFQRDGAEDRFRRLLNTVRSADIVLTSSNAVADDIRRHLGPDREVTIAPLGVTPALPDPRALPVTPEDPYFVALGTIEPRKNIGLLLDVWDQMPDPPTLYLCGARGWNNEAVFRRLDQGVPGVVELPGLGDRAVAALLQGAKALLFPSLAEGYGLPPLEAAALGTRVVCAPSRIAREVLGDVPVYAEPTDVYAWAEVIHRLAVQPGKNRPAAMTPPNWEDHFNIVRTATRTP